MPDNIPETGHVVITAAGHTQCRRTPSARFLDRTNWLRNPRTRNGWHDPVPSDLESICGFQRARAAPRKRASSVKPSGPLKTTN